MSRKILSVLLAAFLVVGFASFMTKADVTGSFKATVVILPIPCGVWLSQMNATIDGRPVGPLDCEDTLQKSDFESFLNLNWTISGLTLGLSTHMGFTGFEDIVTSLKASLGALNITDQFVFAVPFGTDVVVIQNKHQTQTDSELMFTVVNPDIFFVKKRVTASISIAGITLNNLAILEDINFPKVVIPEIIGLNFPVPGGGSSGGLACRDFLGAFISSTGTFANGGRCPLLPTQASVKGFNVQSQAFRFGDTLTITGQTVSGITVTNITAIGMDPQLTESLKKVNFNGVVCTNPKLQFAVEKISVVGIPLGPVKWNTFAEFRMSFSDTGPNAIGAPGFVNSCLGTIALEPNGAALLTAVLVAPFFWTNDFTFSTPLGTIEAFTETSNVTRQFLDEAVLTLAAGDVTITQAFNSQLQPAATLVELSSTLNPDSNPASLDVVTAICQSTAAGEDFVVGCPPGFGGIGAIIPTLSVSRQGVTVSISARFGSPFLGNAAGNGTLNGVTLNRVRFTVTATAGPINLSLRTQWRLGDPADDRIEFSAGVNF
jgi:hypothetical protein